MLERENWELATVRLTSGSHSSPAEGVCIVELASVLAGEKFSDRPNCVCEVIAAFLRAWNDRASHADRQRLLPFAERIAASRHTREVSRIRRNICLDWSGIPCRGPRLLRPVVRLWARARILVHFGFRSSLRLNRGSGELAARISVARYGTTAALALLDELLAVGEPPAAPREPGSANGRDQHFVLDSRNGLGAGGRSRANGAAGLPSKRFGPNTVSDLGRSSGANGNGTDPVRQPSGARRD
jgi:hypothetical protein